MWVHYQQPQMQHLLLAYTQFQKVYSLHFLCLFSFFLIILFSPFYFFTFFLEKYILPIFYTSFFLIFFYSPFSKPFKKHSLHHFPYLGMERIFFGKRRYRKWWRELKKGGIENDGENIFWKKGGIENDGENVFSKKGGIENGENVFPKKVKKKMGEYFFSKKGGIENDGENIFFDKKEG